MSRKYIRQQIIENFVYPNNKVSQYDIDGIIHEINDNSVSGIVNSFSASLINSTTLNISYNNTWNLNNAEPWITNDGLLVFFSIHMLAAGQDYFKPWRQIQRLTTTTTTLQTYTTPSLSFNVNATDIGLTGFTTGTYYFEIRFIGHRSIYPVCINVDLTAVSPTPTPSATQVTPTPTATQTTPTPTPTQSVTPTPTATSGGNELIVYAKYVNSTDEVGYALNGGSYTAISQVPSTTCTLITVITGVTNGDTFAFSCLNTSTIGGSTVNCPVGAGGCTYNYTYTGSGTQFVYLTIDGSEIC